MINTKKLYDRLQQLRDLSDPDEPIVDYDDRIRDINWLARELLAELRAYKDSRASPEPVACEVHLQRKTLPDEPGFYRFQGDVSWVTYLEGDWVLRYCLPDLATDVWGEVRNTSPAEWEDLPRHGDSVPVVFYTAAGANVLDLRGIRNRAETYETAVGGIQGILDELEQLLTWVVQLYAQNQKWLDCVQACLDAVDGGDDYGLNELLEQSGGDLHEIVEFVRNQFDQLRTGLIAPGTPPDGPSVEWLLTRICVQNGATELDGPGLLEEEASGKVRYCCDAGFGSPVLVEYVDGDVLVGYLTTLPPFQKLESGVVHVTSAPDPMWQTLLDLALSPEIKQITVGTPD